MHIAGLEQIFANLLACSTLKEHVIRQDNCGTSVSLEQRFDMLDKVKLFIAGRCCKIGSCNGVILFTGITFRTEKGYAALPSEGGIGEHDVALFLRWGEQAILDDNGTTSIIRNNAVQEEIHDAQASGVVDNFPAIKSIVA
jgi:hypothetical protein